MSTAQNLVQNAYWGVSSFNLYVAKCSVGCEVCTGDITSQCIKCVKKFGLQKSKCIPAPPLECSYVRINQVVGLIVNLINPFQLKIVELDLIMNEIGSKQLFVDDIISSISLQIQVQCQEQKVISSYFRTCDGCESEQFSFYNLCLNQSNIIVYNTIFLQILESEKELLITMSQQKIEIIQISIINDVETEILILKIEI
ncbi:unnamed protein product [Paramecium primaurelia]|uniref:Uncharacterized protein n=1 Tax=Paramecium primaurelia TaxID=5886 RepID=A0A8S1NXK3_PARPR|nr:unnamed protein product [Paramecium primaurelia]